MVTLTAYVFLTFRVFVVIEGSSPLRIVYKYVYDRYNINK